MLQVFTICTVLQYRIYLETGTICHHFQEPLFIFHTASFSLLCAGVKSLIFSPLHGEEKRQKINKILYPVCFLNVQLTSQIHQFSPNMASLHIFGNAESMQYSSQRSVFLVYISYSQLCKCRYSFFNITCALKLHSFTTSMTSLR